MLVPPVAARAQRVEQDPAERVVVEGVVVVGFRRELAAPVALHPGQLEAFCRGADDLPASGAQERRELVGQRGLAGRGRPVDRDPQRVRGRGGLDRPGQPVKSRRECLRAWPIALPAPACLRSCTRRPTARRQGHVDVRDAVFR